ncbi:hypothetical protein GJ496_000254 [Pomphorhynchus laevis]|nr:hypothetical protein GJ496_000254 [Pomphorhynchus laevis]
MVSLREKTRMHVSETSSILSIYTPDSTYAEPERRELSPYNQTKTKENETKENTIEETWHYIKQLAPLRGIQLTI